MALLPVLTREQIAPDLLPLWDACAERYPGFRHLWATMANSPTIFRHIWGELLELAERSPVAARHFEMAIVAVSALTGCRYCVSHHAPLAERAGLAPEQVAVLEALRLGPLAEDHAFPPRPGFTRADGLVIDLACFVVWNGVWPHVADVHPRTVHALRWRLFALLGEHFTAHQIEDLVWRTCQCVAFNWHNDLLELDLEPGVAPRPVQAGAARGPEVAGAAGTRAGSLP
jgi:AhpD family alkylhydroperoxidase